MSDALRALLDSLIDYAGLFPPAGLGMAEAAQNYEAYRTGPRAWALGRFIVPVARLQELGERPGWRISALGGADIDADVRTIESNQMVDSIETKALDASDVRRIAEAVAGRWPTYVEITDLALIEDIESRNLRAKFRTGGVTPQAIPNVAPVAEFLMACQAANVPFKATAGLHHPIRCMRPLTYEADAPRGVMHGFLNVFMAAAFTELAREILAEQDAAAFVVDRHALGWRDLRITAAQLKDLRKRAVSFGSCSFEEPIADLEEMKWLS